MLIGTVMAIALGRKAASQQAAQQEALQQQLAAQQAQQAALEAQQQPQAGSSSANVEGREKRQNPKAGRRNRTKRKAGEGTNEPAGDGVTVHDPAASARTPGGTFRKHKGPRQPASSENANVAPGSWRKRSANEHAETAAKAAAPSSNTDNVADASGALLPNSSNDHASSSTAFGASTTHATKPTPTVGTSSGSRGRGRASSRDAAHGSFSRNTDGPVARPSRGRGRGGRGTTTQQPEQHYQRAPIPDPPGGHLVDAAATQPSSARAAGPQFLRQRAMERQGHEQAASGTLPEWRSRNPRHANLKHLVEQQVEQNATQASPFPTLSQTTAGRPTLHLPAPIPAHTDRPMVQRPKPRSKARKSRADHYDLVVEAAYAATSVLDKLGLRCALFGSLASRLYGSARCPKDADLLVFPPPDQEELTEAEIKARIVDTDAHFFLKLPRDPSKEYRILWYKKDSGGRGQECKVDILTPGTMSLPYLRQEEVKWLHVRRSAVATDEHDKGKGKTEEGVGLGRVDTIGDANSVTESDGPALPVCPYPVVLLHKLQGWSDHRVAPEKFKRNKQHQDAGDVRRLLALKHEVDTLLSASGDVEAIWTNTGLFPPEFQDVSRKRIRLYCRAFPQRKAEWMMLGFNTELMPGDAEEEDEAVRKAVEGWTVANVEDQDQEEEGDDDGQE